MLSWVRTPAFLLLILSPLFAEIISGATPLFMIFNPLVVLLFVSFYGSGSLLIRELTHRWQKGWPTILMLGAAFALVEEGLMTKVFYNPSSGISPLVDYGRIFEVNVPFVLQLIPYHTIISIAVPIFLTSYIFADKKSGRWVGDGKIKFLWAVLILSAFLGSVLIFTYQAPPIPYLATALAAILLFLKARRLPTKIVGDAKSIPGGMILVILGGLFTTLLLGSAFLLPGFGLHPVATALFLIALMIIGIRTLVGWSNNKVWLERDQLSIVTGVILGLIVFNVLLIILGRVEMIFSIILTMALLFWVWKRK